MIFICDFDPFGGKKYRYTFTRRCEEDLELCLAEGKVESKAEAVLEFLGRPGRYSRVCPRENYE